MKILLNSTYEDLLNQIKQSDHSIRYHLQKERDLERQLENEVLKNEQLKAEKDKATKTNVELLEKRDLLKLQVESLQDSLVIMSKKLQSAYAKSGGLKHHNNKLSKELSLAQEKIENYKEEFEKRHIKLTINQYDKRLKPIKKKRK